MSSVLRRVGSTSLTVPNTYRPMVRPPRSWKESFIYVGCEDPNPDMLGILGRWNMHARYLGNFAKSPLYRDNKVAMRYFRTARLRLSTDKEIRIPRTWLPNIAYFYDTIFLSAVGLSAEFDKEASLSAIDKAKKGDIYEDDYRRRLAEAALQGAGVKDKLTCYRGRGEFKQ